MKVAIPTDDQIKISKDILRCKGYLVYEIDDHSLINYEFLINPFPEDTTKAKTEILNTLEECSSIICNRMETNLKEKLKSNHKQILTTFKKMQRKL